MNYKEKLDMLRIEIDMLDKNMLALFMSRLDVCDKIADIKMAGDIRLTDNMRERRVIETALESAPEDKKSEVILFMETVIALSKKRQAEKLGRAE